MPIDLDFPLEDTVEGQLWLETQSRIQDLALEGIPSPARVVTQLVPWLLEGQDVPCILVCPDSVSSDPDKGTNERDDSVFRYIITFIFANDRNITEGAGIMAHWKERVRRKMQNKSRSTWAIDLPSGMFLRSRIPDTTSPLMIAAKQQMGLNAMFLAVEFDVREPRE